MRDGVRTPSRRDICSHSTCAMCSSDTAWLPKGLRQTWADIHARHAHARGCSRNHAHSVGGAASEAPKAAGCSRDMQITIHKHMRRGAETGVRRAGSAVEGGSGRASPTASPVLMPGQSLKGDHIKPHAKARTATGNLKPVPARRVGTTQGPRAPWGHTRTLSVAPPRPSGMGFGLAMAAQAFACGRIRSLRRDCRGGWREEEGRERRGGALGRGGVGEGRDGCGGVVVRVMVRETSPMPGCTPVPWEDRGPRQMLP